MVATAVVIALVFLIIHLIVKTTVYFNLDHALSYQAQKHTHEIFIEGDSIRFLNKAEWEEREHKEVEIHPVFMQINNKTGRLMDKSPNLKDQVLEFEPNPTFVDPHTTFLGGREIRQAQIPLEQNGQIKGYILVAMPLEDTTMVLNNLKTILLILYPIVIFGLFEEEKGSDGGIFVAAVLARIEQSFGNGAGADAVFEVEFPLPSRGEEQYVLGLVFQKFDDGVEVEK